MDILGVDGAWPALSMALSSGTLSVKSAWPSLPLNAHVALVGDGPTYNALAGSSGGFTSIFRYETWINSTVSWTPRAEATYAALADGVARFNKLPAFDPSGVAKLVEEGARRSDGMNRSYLTADLVTLRDIAVEAGRQALARSASMTSGQDILTAMQRRRRLQGASAQRVREAILSGPLWASEYADQRRGDRPDQRPRRL
jgi:predicted ATP-dependent protease